MSWPKLKICFFVLIVQLFSIEASNQAELDIIAEWKNMAFSFDTAEQEQYALDKGFYDPIGQKRPYDSDLYVTKNGEWRKFLSLPRVSNGIPYTLAEVVNGNFTSKGPLIRAYPNADMHLNRSCNGLLSVFRIYVETACDRLWVIDSGRDFFAGPPTQVCPPKIVAFDLKTDTVTFSYEIPKEYYTPEVSVFNGITLRPSLSCDATTGYIPDARAYSLIVFKRNKEVFESWRVKSDYFKADPQYFNTTVANESFRFIDGLYTVAPSIRQQIMYFHPFASLTEYAIPLFLVDLQELWSHNLNLDSLFKTIGNRPTQSSIEAVDSCGNLFFTLMDPTLGIFCWNIKNPYNKENFKLVVEDSEVLQFVVGLKIRIIPEIGEVIVGISNRLQKHNTGTVNPNEINYRMFILPIGQVKCY